MKNAIIAILVLAVLGLGGFVAYDKAINKAEEQKELNSLKDEIKTLKQENTNMQEKAEESTSNNIAGEYQVIIKSGEINPGPGLESYIDLMEDGTFYKSDMSTAKQWWYGTYTLENGMLTLKSNFTVSSDVQSAQDSNDIFTYKVENNQITDIKNDHLKYTKNEKESAVQKEFIEQLKNISKYYAQNAS